MRSAETPGPGRRRGHDVTMRNFCVCARAMEGAASVPAPRTPSAARRSSFFIFISVFKPLPHRMEMMDRPVSVADAELICRGDRGGHIVLRQCDRVEQTHPP